MANGSTVQYVITIKGEGSGGSGGSQDKSGVAKTTEGKDAGGLKIGRKTVTAAAAMVAAKVVTTSINRVGVTTGHTTMQQRLNAAYSNGTSALMTGAAIVGGLVTQNYLAVVAGVASAVNSVIDMSIAEMNINTQRRVDAVSIRQANIRAGAGGDRNGKATY